MCILLLCPTFILGIIILSIWVSIKNGIDIKLNTKLQKFAFFLSLSLDTHSHPFLPSQILHTYALIFPILSSQYCDKVMLSVACKNLFLWHLLKLGVSN